MTQRLPDIDPAALEPEGRRVYDAILSGPRGIVEGPLRVWLNSPALADRAQALGAFCRFGTTLPPRLSELAICIIGAYWRAGFEWHVHAPIAEKAGVAPAVLEAIKAGTAPDFAHEDEAALHAFANELLERRRISEATYARARAALGDRALVDLVGILGYYGLISMTIVAFGVPVPEGSPEPFEPLR